jgi:hypothetical protein
MLFANETIDGADDTKANEDNDPSEFGPVVVGSDSSASEPAKDVDEREAEPGTKPNSLNRLGLIEISPPVRTSNPQEPRKAKTGRLRARLH